MSNILIIKHGSLGDIVQISGVLKDIREHHKSDKIYFMTTNKFSKLFKNCPYVDNIILDERRARINFFYYFGLFRKLNSLKFAKVYDLQNSSRTHFYQRFLRSYWSSTRNILTSNETKENFDKESVLERFQIQLKRSGIEKCENTLYPDFNWAVDKDYRIKFQKYIYIAPFSSKNLVHKRWPYFKDLINIIKQQHHDLDLVTAPGNYDEIKLAKKIGLEIILNHNNPTSIQNLASIIKNSKFVISNDTGPAHLAAHLGCKGLALFGGHTTPEKVSIETGSFLSISSKNIRNISMEEVFDKIDSHL